MNNTFRDTLVLIAIISAALAAFSAEEAKKKAYDLPTYTIEDIAALPEPVRFSGPAVSQALVGFTIRLKLTIDENGRPEHIRLEKPLFNYRIGPQMGFASELKDSVRKWKFEPARDQNGNAIPVKVILPVQVIEKGTTPKMVASLVLDVSEEQS